jgi:pimeloyl-ACP methyl ester carboxylesterase
MSRSLGERVFLDQAAALRGRRDQRPTLGGIRCPTLVLAGRDDRLCPPPVQQEMARAIPSADLALLARCGHLSPLERPAAVAAALIAWLDRVSEES